MTPPRIVVTSATPELAASARELAAKLGLPYLAEVGPAHAELALSVTADRLELRETAGGGPVYVDFVAGSLGYRRQRGGGRQQPLAKAVGVKGDELPSVLDATAGLGRDAFVLAGLGCRVDMLERSPIVAALLADGLRRAAQDPDTALLAQTRLRLIQADAPDWMQGLAAQARPDVVYLDPMYPPRRKSALVKKEMRLLQILLGEDHDTRRLLDAALRCARRRVVVKRPQGADALAGPPPSMAIHSPNTRFDVYLVAVLPKVLA